MIEKHEAKKQVMRFSGLSFFAVTDEAMKELVMAMCAFETVKDAKNFADDWLATSTETPKPAHIRRCAHGPRVAQFTGVEPTKCTECGDTGWRSRCEIVAGITYPFAEKCPCKGVAVSQ